MPEPEAAAGVAENLVYTGVDEQTETAFKEWFEGWWPPGLKQYAYPEIRAAYHAGYGRAHARAERLATALRALVDGATAVIGLDGDWTNLLVATEALEAARAALAGDAPGRGETR